eukprot:jgi/Botrbrau1/11836/Bobra.0175s0001.1
MERLHRPCARFLSPTQLPKRSNGTVTIATKGKSMCLRRKNYREARVYARDVNPWEGAFTPVADPWKADGPITSDALKAEICKCVDFVNLTYANFWSADDVAKYKPEAGGKAPTAGSNRFGPNELLKALPGLEYPKVLVAEDSPARKYTIGIPGKGGSKGDKSFYLTATSGFYTRELDGGDVEVESTNWIGYVGIGSRQDVKSGPGHLDIVVAFRGSVAKTEWISDFVTQMVEWDGNDDLPVQYKFLQDIVGNYVLGSLPLPGLPRPHMKPKPLRMRDLRSHVCVSSGFEEMYRRDTSTPQTTLSLQGQVQMAVVKLLEHYGDAVGSITVTGHSLGAALATVCAYDLVASEVNRVSNDPDPEKPRIPVTAITFEAPRAGNWAFAEAFHTTDGPRHFRIINVPDVVPKVPYMAFPSGGLLLQLPTRGIVTLRTTLHVFGLPNWFPKALRDFLSSWITPGVEFPRPPPGQPEIGLAYYHGGTTYKVVADWEPSEPLFQPHQLGVWHNQNLVLSKIDPDTRAPTGPRAVVG